MSTANLKRDITRKCIIHSQCNINSMQTVRRKSDIFGLISNYLEHFLNYVLYRMILLYLLLGD